MSVSSCKSALLEPLVAEALRLRTQSKRAAAQRLLSGSVAPEVKAEMLVVPILTLGTGWARRQGLAALVWSAARPALNLPARTVDDLRRAYYTASADAELHRCDEAGARVIIVEELPDAPEWRAIADRLHRASAP